MPHPKNRLKLTGDTHPPEVEYDLGENDELFEPEADTRSQMRRFDDQSGIDVSQGSAVMRRAGPPIPYKAIALTLAAVYVIGKLLRR